MVWLERILRIAPRQNGTQVRSATSGHPDDSGANADPARSPPSETDEHLAQDSGDSKEDAEEERRWGFCDPEEAVARAEARGKELTEARAEAYYEITICQINRGQRNLFNVNFAMCLNFTQNWSISPAPI